MTEPATRPTDPAADGAMVDPGPADQAGGRALVSDIQRFSVHDGPGIRTVLFLKGCNLRCRWCQNPETIAHHNEIVFTADRCVACGDCARACDRGAIVFDRGPRLDRSRCDACGQCAEVCPGRALELAGRLLTPEEALPELLADREFFEPEGGVTLSGGEPLLHHHFLARLLPLVRAAGLTVAVETAGFWEYDKVAPLLPLIDLVLFDLKAADPGRHRELTGVDNRLIIDNLRRLIAAGAAVEPRMPVVPGLNTRPADLAAMVVLLKSLGLPRLTLLPYHRLYESKLKKLGSPLSPLGLAAPGREEMTDWARTLAAGGIEVTTSSLLVA